MVLINQERTDLSVKFGNPITIPGGVGQKYAASLSLRLRTLARKKTDGDDIHEDAPLVKVAATVVKNSFGPMGRGAEYLLAMETFDGMAPGEAKDEDWVRIQARRLGLTNGGGADAEIRNRGDLYRELKGKILSKIGRN